MGLFDFLKKKDAEAAPKAKSEREMARLIRLVSDKLSQNYDRQEAIEELSRQANGPAAAALLKRFGWSMDPSITDQEEKESAVRGIVAAGEEALDPIREYCAKADSLTWALKVLRQIVDGQEFVDELLGLLDQFDTEYVRNPEPKVQLLTTLGDHPSEEVRQAVEPFLQDAAEPVRFAAASAVFAMNNADSVPALVAALEEEESLRVKNRIALGLSERKWSVPEALRDTCSEALPPDYALDGQLVVAR